MNSEMQERFDLQKAEFDAMAELAQHWRAVQMTSIVDDDYPQVRHGYERAVDNFLKACKANGRIV